MSAVAAYFSLGVFGGLAANVGLMQLNSMHKGCANVCTLCQFSFGMMETVLWHPKQRNVLFSSKDRKLPLWAHLIFAFMFFIGPYLGNTSTAITNSDFYPVFLVVRSCGSVASMALGYLFAGKHYSWTQVVAVLAITVGAALTTYGCYVAKSETSHSTDPPTPPTLFLVGVSLLLLNLFNDAGLGVLQQKIFSIYGEAVDETMVFMSGCGTLLMALIAGPEVLAFIRLWISQPTWWSLILHPLSIPPIVPMELGLLTINVVGNWNAKKIQTWLNAHSSAVIGAMVPMIYRLLSTVLSSTVFNRTNAVLPWFTWVGIVVVFAASVTYLLSPSPSTKTKPKSS